MNMRIDRKSKTPRAIYNVGYHVEGVTNHDPKIIADFYLSHNLDLLKMERIDKVRHVITTKTPAGATVRYNQDYKGIDVYDSGIAVTVNNKDVVTFFVSEYKPGVKIPNIFPKISKDAAIDAALQELGVSVQQTTFLETKLVIFANTGEPRLAWKITVSAIKEKIESLEFLFDATNGESVQIKNLIMDKAGSERIRKGRFQAFHAYDDRINRNFEGRNLRGSHTKEVRNMNESLPRIKSLIKFFLAKLPGSYKKVDVLASVYDPNPLATAKTRYAHNDGYRDNRDFNSPELYAALKTVTLKGISLRRNNYYLIGKYARSEDFDYPFDGCFTRKKRLDYIGNRQADYFEAANTYYHIDAYMRYVNEELQLDLRPQTYEGGIIFDAHAENGRDNSYFDRLHERLGFGEGGVDDGEDADVIIHELAHALHQWLTSDNLSEIEGIAEGFADYIAASYSRSRSKWSSDDPEYNWVFAWDGHNEFWRGRVTNIKGKYPHALVGNIHIDGQIWSTCAMKVWDELGREASDKIMLAGISYTGSKSGQEDMANAVVVAAKDLGYDFRDVNKIRKIFSDCGYTISA